MYIVTYKLYKYIVPWSLYSTSMLYKEFNDGTFVTAWKFSASSSVVFVSRPLASSSELHGVLLLPTTFLKSHVLQFARNFRNSSLDPILIRQSLPRKLRVFMSQHLLMGLEQLPFKEDTATADSAWRYEQLLEWGETSAVAVLAKHMRVNTGTMRARMVQARLNGLLDSPGRGSRKL